MGHLAKISTLVRRAVQRFAPVDDKPRGRARWVLRADGSPAPVYDDGTEAELIPRRAPLVRYQGSPLDWLRD